MAYISTKLKEEITINRIITLHYFEYWKGFVFKGEKHNFWEILCIDNGDVNVRVDDQTYRLNRGDMIFHKPNEFHAIESLGNTAPNFVVISFECHSPAMTFFKNKMFSISNHERTLLSYILEEAQKAFSSPIFIPAVEQVTLAPDAPFGSQQMIKLYLEILLIELRRNHSDSAMQKITLKTPHSLNVTEGNLEKALLFMDDHLYDKLTVQDICNHILLGRSSLQLLFNKNKHCGVMDYFLKLKIERAKQLIRDDTMNFTEMAQVLSFSSLQHFSKQFKKITGMSPLKYSSTIRGITTGVGNPAPRHES